MGYPAKVSKAASLGEDTAKSGQNEKTSCKASNYSAGTESGWVVLNPPQSAQDKARCLTEP